MDETTFEQLAPSLRLKALAVCRNCGATACEADDLAQDVMLKLWSMRQQLDRYRSVEALAAVIASNLTLSTMRSSAARRTVALGDDFDSASTARNAQQQLEFRELEREVADMVQRLPSTQHSVLVMRQVEHRSNAEIARLLGIGEASVSTLLARARRKMLEEIRRKRLA